MINKNERYNLAAKASFLKERIEGNFMDFILSCEKASIEKKYNLWQEKVGGKGRSLAFEKRLRLDDLSIEGAKLILSDISWKTDCDLPWWTKEIEEIINMFPIKKEKLVGKHLFYQSSLNKDPLRTEIFIPFMQYGEKKLNEVLKNQNILLHDKVLIDMSFLLMNKLESILMQTTKHKFKIFIEDVTKKSYIYHMFHKEKSDLEKYRKDFFNALLAGGWKDILLEFPVLSRLTIITITNWRNSLVEIIKSLEKDRRNLEKTFNNDMPLGELIGIEGGLSDSHNNGKCVYILEFSKGIKIVYKPRKLLIDQVWEELIKTLEINGLQSDIKTPKVLTYKNYGWMEFIDRIPLKRIETVEKYYYRAGVVLAIIYALGGTDFHSENVFAWGNQLALIDTETLLSYSISPYGIMYGESSVEGEVYKVIKTTLLNTGLLTFWSKGMYGEHIDLGGITSIASNCKNSPLLGSEIIDATAYHKEIIEGFEKAYDFLLNNKKLFLVEDSILNGFKDCKFRFVIRNTQLYSNLLSHMTQPKYLRDGLTYSLEIERLATGFMLVSSDESEEDLWRIFQSERDALERSDIPIFYGRGTEKVLMDSEKVLSEEYFAESMIDRSKAIIRRMDAADKKSQIDYIRYSIAMKKWKIHPKHSFSDHSARMTNGETYTFDRQILIDEALRIYDSLLLKSIRNKKGNFTWISGQYNFKAEIMSIDQMGLSLYDGIVGTAVFMSALYDFTGKKIIKRNTLLLIENLRKRLYHEENPLLINSLGLGLGNGLAGIIKGLMTIGDYLKEDDIKQDALYLAKKIEKIKIEKAKTFDVLTGSAGLILSLAEVYNTFKDERVYELLELCGKNLLKHRAEDKSSIGFGCGVVGITSALDKLYAITKDEEVHKIISELHHLEAPLSLNLNERFKKQSLGWCTGIVGLGFSKFNRGNLKNEEENINEILSMILESPMIDSDDLCCGNSGIIDFIVESAIKLDDNIKLEAAQRRMMAMILSYNEKGYYSYNGSQYETLVNPSLFKGLSGIGYEMLRCLSPNRYVSLLY